MFRENNVRTTQLKDGTETRLIWNGLWRRYGQPGEQTTPDQDQKDDEAVRRSLRLGEDHWDVAKFYGSFYGRAEQEFGRVLEEEGFTGEKRGELYIVTKALAHEVNPERIWASTLEAIERLKASYLNLLVFHHPPEETDPGKERETLEVCRTLIESGLVQSFGVSNYDLKRLENTANLGEIVGVPIVTNQVHYSLGVREAERTHNNRSMLEFAREAHIVISAWQPLLGVLPTENDSSEEAAQRIQLLTEIAGYYETTFAQVALNWLTSQGIIAVVKASSEEHILDNRAATEWEMEEKHVERLRHAFPGQVQKSPVYSAR